MRKKLVVLITCAVWVILNSEKISGASGFELVVQNGHSGGIKSLAYSRDGKFIATGSADHRIFIWSSKTGSLIRRLSGHKNYVTSVDFSPRGSLLASGSMDGKIILWSPDSDVPVKTINTGFGATGKVLFSPDGKYLAYGKKEISLLESKSGKKKMTIQNPHPGFIRVGAFSPHGRYLAALTGKNRIDIFDIENQKEVKSLSGHTGLVQAVAWSPDGKMLASGSLDGTVRIWDINSGRGRKINPGNVFALGFSPDGKKIAAGVSKNYRYSLIVISALTGRILYTRDTGGDLVTSLSFSPHGKQIASGSSEKKLTLWDSGSGHILKTMSGRADTVYNVEFTRQGRYFLSSSWNRISIWDRETACETGSLSGHPNFGVGWFALSGKGDLLLSGGRDKILSIYEVPSGKALKRIKINKIIAGISASPDGRNAAVILEDGMVQIYSLPGGRRVKLIKTGMPASTGEGFRLAFSPLKSLFAVATSYEPVRIFNYRSGKMIGELKTPDMGTWITKKSRFGLSRTMERPAGYRGLSPGAEKIVFSPDGKYLAAGSNDMTVKLWDVSSGKLVRVMRGHRKTVSALAYSPAGDMIASSTYNGRIFLWDPGSGKLQGKLKGHSSMVRNLSFSPDGNAIISGSNDGTVKYWNRESENEVCTFASFGSGRDWIVYTGDGYFDSSRKGGKYLGIRKGREVFSIDQFALQRNRPDIILQRMGTGKNEIREHLKHRYMRRLKRAGFSSGASGELHVPGAKIISGRREGKFFHIKFSLEDSKYDLKSYNVFVNNVPLFGARGKSLDDDSVTVNEKIELTHGTNKIEISCINEKGAESYRAMTISEYAVKSPGDLYFLGFGVSEYRNTALNLKYAHKDSLDLKKIFERMAGGRSYGKVYTRVFTNEQVTPEAIRNAGSFIKNAKPDDTFILFIAGHGLHDTDPAATYYYLTFNADISNLAGTCASFEEIEGLLQGIAPRKKLFLMDTCESGEVEDKIEKAYFSSAQERRGNARAVRGFTIKAKRTVKPRPWLLQRERFIYNDLSRRSGAIVFSSSKGGEFSYEGGSVNNGYFTAEIINCLTGSRKKIISMEYLREFVGGAVSKRSGGMQNPTVDRDNLYLDFSLPGVR